jgi:chitin disaccharide deacetylase
MRTHRIPRPQLSCIVNADDLGMSVSVNDAIFELIALGRVTSATLIANGPGFENAAKRAKQFPWASFGVHLNVTQFAPLSKNEGLRPLLASNGEFAGNLRSSGRLAENLRSLFLAPSTRSALLNEFQLQIDLVRAHIGEISHVDSHHHVHTIPSLFPILRHLVRRNGISAVRISTNLHEPQLSPGIQLRTAKMLWNAAVRSLSVNTTDHFTELPALLLTPPRRDCTVEIMTHPGHEKYQSELLLLKHGWEERVPAKIQLINYNDLSAMRARRLGP